MNHAAKECVKIVHGGQRVTPNTVQGHFTILKRGVTGVNQHVGLQHLRHYLSEFDFRYNARDVSDAERALLPVKQTGGKRLM